MEGEPGVHGGQPNALWVTLGRPVPCQQGGARLGSWGQSQRCCFPYPGHSRCHLLPGGFIRKVSDSKLPSFTNPSGQGRKGGWQAGSIFGLDSACRERKERREPRGYLSLSPHPPACGQPQLGLVQPRPSDCSSGLWTEQFEFLSTAWTAAVTCCLVPVCGLSLGAGGRPSHPNAEINTPGQFWPRSQGVPTLSRARLLVSYFLRRV